jgi:hypothetical protein
MTLFPASRFLPVALALGLLSASAAPLRAQFPSLNLGVDYRLRGIAIENPDYQGGTKDHLNYYSQAVRFYTRSWLNEDIEASFRLQSINVWGLEGRGLPAGTRYPAADGTPWVEQMYIHLPNLAWNKVDLIVGRQPIVWGDGMLISDDELGFNALRAQVDLPWAFDMDLFTAKSQEALAGKDDSDVYGFLLGTNREHNRWELGWLQERHYGPTPYVRPTSTATATKILREFYDVRLFGNLQGAYYKLELALQKGSARIPPPGRDVKIRGVGQKLELGAQTDTVRFGRFGVRAIWAEGSGDDAGTDGTDEAFRPAFARRWDGLQRIGYGDYFAATLSDAYDNTAPFSSSPTATGLPLGFSGIRTMGLGIFSTQAVRWTAALDYYTYLARTKPTGQNDLGSEIDAEILYRYTGFVTFRLGGSFFFPGPVFGNTATRVTVYRAEAHVHF